MTAERSQRYITILVERPLREIRLCREAPDGYHTILTVLEERPLRDITLLPKRPLKDTTLCLLRDPKGA